MAIIQGGNIIEGPNPRPFEVRLTNAQMLALRATPQTLIAAPGAGKAIVLEGDVELFLDVTTAGYTEDADNLAIEYADGTDILTIEATGFVDQATDQFRKVSAAVGLSTPVQNSAIRIVNNGAEEFGGGNAANTLTIRGRYRVLGAVA